MPVVDLKLACELSPSALRPLLTSLAGAVARILAKPPSDVLVLCTPAFAHLGGSDAPAAFVSVRCISGLTAETAQALCEAVRLTLQAASPIDPARVYLDLSHIEPGSAWRFIDGDAASGQPGSQRRSAMTEWSIRTLLNPVLTRLLIAGVNPIDLERVIVQVENTKLLHSRQLEQTWVSLWEKQSQHYINLAETALTRGYRQTAREMLLFAANAYLACFLINFASLDEKKRVYLRYAELYARAGALFPSAIRLVEVPLGQGHALPALLHLPDSGEAQGGAVIYSGLGSCKEEMHGLARALADRGVAVLVPDMPGSGEALFVRGLPCQREHLDRSFSPLLDTLCREAGVATVGCVGLCMGGGYAYRAAAREPRHRFCVGLFPLFVDQCDAEVTPQWMQAGAWFDLQSGGLPAEEFRAQMGLGPDEIVHCPFFMVHGRHDNWMTLDRAMGLFDRAQSACKETLIIDEAPVFAGDGVFTHAMPVGEQLHWVRAVAADWAVQRLREPT